MEDSGTFMRCGDQGALIHKSVVQSQPVNRLQARGKLLVQAHVTLDIVPPAVLSLGPFCWLGEACVIRVPPPPEEGAKW